MSKKSKAESKQKNLRAKRARKAANRAQYQAWATLGENTKSKRFKSKAKKFKTTLHRNNFEKEPCGNIGCKHCNPSGC